VKAQDSFTAAEEARERISDARGFDEVVPAGTRMLFEAIGAVAVAIGRLADAVTNHRGSR